MNVKQPVFKIRATSVLQSLKRQVKRTIVKMPQCRVLNINTTLEIRGVRMANLEDLGQIRNHENLKTRAA